MFGAISQTKSEAGAGAALAIDRLQFEAARLCELPAISHFMRDGFISTQAEGRGGGGGGGARHHPMMMMMMMVASTDSPLQLQAAGGRRQAAARAGDQVRKSERESEGASEPADV